MNWLTTIWTSFITLALALTGVYFVLWLRRREWLYLLFVLFGISIAVQAATEVWMFRADTLEEYGLALRMFHVPVFISFVTVVGIIHLSFKSGRLWLGIVACGLRFVSLVVNFVQDPNVNYVALTHIGSITLLGEPVTTVEGESSPWMLTGQLALITLLIYVLNAGFSVWRRDRNMRAVFFCVALALLVLVGTLQGIFVFWGLVPTPMLAAPFFIGIALVLGIEVGLRYQRAEQLEDMLQESKVQLEQVSHAAAMTELSGALAHEINQPLGIILSNAEAASILLESDHPDTEELRDIVGDIISADQRAADVIVRLRSLLQRGDPDLQDCDLNEVIDEATGHLANEFRARGIFVQRDTDNEVPLVSADRILLVQVVLNLLGNARDAVSQNPDGQRIVKISSSANEEDIVVAIEDNGVGIAGDPERIFDAFVTSKKSGMGMGLAISKSIVEAHDGKITCKSTIGSGTVFQVSIPQKSAIS